VLARILVGIATGCLLLGFGPDGDSAPSVASAQAYQNDASQNTHLMQQMDHRRRLSKQELEDARASAAGSAPGVAEADLSSASVDYAVVGILGVTGVVLYAVCRRRSGWPRRRSRVRRPVRPLP
jgi:hypothetical protein